MLVGRQIVVDARRAGHGVTVRANVTRENTYSIRPSM